MTADKLIKMAQECDMFVTTEMKWQYERWVKLAIKIEEYYDPIKDKTKVRNAVEETLPDISRHEDLSNGAANWGLHFPIGLGDGRDSIPR